MKNTVLLTFLFCSACANVSIRNFNPAKLKPEERTIVGSFEVINEAFDNRILPECKLSFLLPNGKDVRRYFPAKEDKGLVVTWTDTGKVKLHSVDCQGGSFGVKLVDQDFFFVVDPKDKLVYFGHIQIRVIFTGLSDAAGAGAMGSLGMMVAGASRTSQLKKVSVEDRWTKAKPVFKELFPEQNAELVKKSLARR